MEAGPTVEMINAVVGDGTKCRKLGEVWLINCIRTPQRVLGVGFERYSLLWWISLYYVIFNSSS
jgi:hypothetical protein